MRVLKPSELNRCTRQDLLRRIASELSDLKEGSTELHNAHINLRNIRSMLARPEFRPG